MNPSREYTLASQVFTGLYVYVCSVSSTVTKLTRARLRYVSSSVAQHVVDWGFEFA